jgi:aminoglycoside 3-N-acetyltransferase
MKKINDSSSISDILIDLEVKKGDVLYLTIDMSKIPLPEIKVELSSKSYKDRQDRWCQYVYEQILSVIGRDGTLILHSFSYGYIHGKEFDVDRTDSEVGPFTNYVRLLPQAMRSLHPVFSLTGIGKNAKNILSNCGKAGFGPSSPFYRLSKFNTIFVSLGTTIGESMTYIHHLEQMHGVTYRFNQCFSHTVISKGIEVSGPWVVNLRYLNDGLKPDLMKAEIELINSGVVELFNGENIHQSVRIVNVDEVINNMLLKNPAALIQPSVLKKVNDRLITYTKC